jgi:tripartite-type tricarboxylate transporter receptor subunit TctC
MNPRGIGLGLILLLAPAVLATVFAQAFPSKPVRVITVFGAGTAGDPLAERSSALPRIPTTAKAGVTGYHYAVWLGCLAPAGTAPEVIGKVHAEITRALRAPDMRHAFDRLEFQAVSATPSPSSPRTCAPNQTACLNSSAVQA